MEETFVNLLSANQRKLYQRGIVTLHEAFFGTLVQDGHDRSDDCALLCHLWCHC